MRALLGATSDSTWLADPTHPIHPGWPSDVRQ